MSPGSGAASVSPVPSVPRRTKSGASAEQGRQLAGGRAVARSQKPRAQTVFRTACEGLSAAVKESPGSSRCVHTGRLRRRRARVPRGRGLRASGATARTALDLHGMTLPLPKARPGWSGRKWAVGTPRALPAPRLQGSSLCHRLSCPPVPSAGFPYPSEKALLWLSRWGCFPLPARHY